MTKKKPNQLTLRNQKGWIGYCRMDHVNMRKRWKEVDWTTGGTIKPKSETKNEMGVITQKW